jgi:hypothetical protein
VNPGNDQQLARLVTNNMTDHSNDDVSMIQSAINAARSVRRGEPATTEDLPASWQPIVNDALAQLAALGVHAEKTTVEWGRLRIIAATREAAARAIIDQASDDCGSMCARCGESAGAYNGYMPACFEHASEAGIAFQSLRVLDAFPSRMDAWAWWRTPHPDLNGAKPCDVAVREGGKYLVKLGREG